MYLQRWRSLERSAWLYLAHAALLTGSLAITSLLYNLAVLALGYTLGFLGILNVLGVAAAAALSIPVWFLVSRIGLRRALVFSALLQAAAALSLAIWPEAVPLAVAAAGTGIAAVLFQVTAAPFMMRHSDDSTRDHLFSANASVNIGIAGLGSLFGGYLPSLSSTVLGVGVQSALAYRAAFAIAGFGLALSVVPLLLIAERPPQAENTKPPSVRLSILDRLRRWQGFLTDRVWIIMPLLVPPAIISWGAALLIPYLNLFFRARFALADSTLGTIFAALGLVAGLAALAGPLLSLRIGKVRTIIVTQALSIPFLLILGFVPVLGVAVAAALARGMLFNMSSPLYDAFAMERSEEEARPLVIGLINAAYASGYLVAPAISAAIQQRWGFAPLFIATAMLYALAVAATTLFFARRAAGSVDSS